MKRVGLGNSSNPTRLHGWRPVGHDSVSMQKLYRRYLHDGIADYLDPWPIWSAGDVRYQTIDANHVRANALLGRGLAARVRPFHVVLAALTLSVGAVSGGQALTIAWVSRRAQYGTLRALGWSRLRLVQLAVCQAVLLASVASVLAAVPVAVFAAETDPSVYAVVLALMATTAAAIVAAGAAAVVAIATALLLSARALLAARNEAKPTDAPFTPNQPRRVRNRRIAPKPAIHWGQLGSDGGNRGDSS